MAIVKNRMEKPFFFIMDFEGSYRVLLRHKYFWSTCFWQWKEDPFKSFWNFHKNAFCSFSFLNESKITFSVLMIRLKCTVVHYANLNSSSINNPYLRAVEYASFFFRFLIYVYFNEAFVKSVMKKLSFFNANFQNSFQEYYRILGW